MSRVGKSPINIPKDVTVTRDGQSVDIKGPKGELKYSFDPSIDVELKDNNLYIYCNGTGKQSSALHGVVRSLIANYIHGVSEGWSKSLELEGVGYKASLSGSDLVLNLGFTHPIVISPLQGISIEVKGKKIIVSGFDKHLVGLVAARIRATKKPEPYKGKGMRYEGERIRKKAGKAAKVVGVAVGP